MIALAVAIAIFAGALVGTAALLRSTVLGYESMRIAWAREKWDERVDEAVAAAESEAQRLTDIEAEVVALEKRVSALQTAAGFRPSRLRGA